MRNCTGQEVYYPHGLVAFEAARYILEEEAAVPLSEVEEIVKTEDQFQVFRIGTEYLSRLAAAQAAHEAADDEAYPSSMPSCYYSPTYGEGWTIRQEIFREATRRQITLQCRFGLMGGSATFEIERSTESLDPEGSARDLALAVLSSTRVKYHPGEEDPAEGPEPSEKVLRDAFSLLLEVGFSQEQAVGIFWWHRLLPNAVSYSLQAANWEQAAKHEERWALWRLSVLLLGEERSFFSHPDHEKPSRRRLRRRRFDGA